MSHLIKPVQHTTGIIAAIGLMLLMDSSVAMAAPDAERLAKSLGREMAGAKYCNLDPGRVEVLERNFFSRLASEAESRLEYVQAQQVYIENVRKYERREPGDGCQAVIGRLQSPEQRDIQTLNQRMQTLENLTVQQLEALKEAQQN